MLEFLNANSGAFTGVAALVGTVIAAIYTWYTTMLWRAAADQARISSDQVDLMRRQLVLQEEQAAVSARAFALINRPRIQITSELHRSSLKLGSAEESDVLLLSARNFGAAVATITNVECSLSGQEFGVWMPIGHSVTAPPNDEPIVGRVLLTRTAPKWQWSPDYIPSATELKSLFRYVHVYIDYVGIDDVTYRTGVTLSMCGDPTDRDHWMINSNIPAE